MEAALKRSGSIALEPPSPPMSFSQAVTLLDTRPGVDRRGAEVLVAEWGPDMGRFGTASRLAAWTGVAA